MLKLVKLSTVVSLFYGSTDEKNTILYNDIVQRRYPNRRCRVNQLTSKQQIYNYLQKKSHHFQSDQLSSLTTISISKALNISRSLTSQYLNELVKDNKVIKISSRPVYYISRDGLEKQYQFVLKNSEYLSIHELKHELRRNSPELKDFQKAIGYEGSLSYPISQMKSALLYPDGLPMILHGEKGSGKTYLVKCMHEFYTNHSKSKAQIALFVKKALKEEQACKQMEEIFGSEQKGIIHKGMLELADGGLFCIRDASNLCEACQEKLAEFIRYGKFTRMYNDTTYVSSRVRLILCVDKEPRIVLSPNLLLNIPILCNIPALIERNEDERTQFVIRFFQQEQQHLGRKIYISEKLKRFLVSYKFESNIDELQKAIKAICANAFSECHDNENMNVYVYHLVPNLLNQMSVDRFEKDNDALVRVDTIEKYSTGSKILQMWEQMLQAYKAFVQGQYAISRFFELGQGAVRRYYDILVFEEAYRDARVEAMKNIVMDVLSLVKTAKNINLPVNCAYVLTRMVISAGRNASLLNQWESDHHKEICDCLLWMTETLVDEATLTDQIVKQIHAATNIRLTEINRIFLMLNIRMYNKDIHAQDTMGIILSHGYSTASSIADAANSLLGTYVFEAIDMPLDTPVEEVSKKLNMFIENNTHLKNIILLVDMGSLEGLGDVIAESVNVGVINNISTSLALNIGNKMMQNYSLEALLSEACQENQCHYKVLSLAKKEKAIVFTNDAGVAVSEKLGRLFRDSLPRPIDLKFIEYDYDALVENQMSDSLFKKYDIVLMLKPYQLKLKRVTSVSLEEIMSFGDIDVVNRALKPYLDDEEIEQFNQQLLKNFSMQSVMENLTILNAPKLLDFVSDSVQNLQLLMQRKFQSRTIIGIYIHVCFLVERLVTKTAFDKYASLSNFQEVHKDFIEQVYKSFELMLKHYHVQMPISEIAYLYEYIENDDRKVQGEDEF